MKEKIFTKKLEAAKEAAALQVLEESDAAWEESQRTQSLMLVGGIHVAQRLSSSLKSEVLRAVAEFGKGGHYKALGFESFADFLDNSEFSPMSKSAFYEQQRFLTNEGSETFDLLNAINFPRNKRRMLSKGNVQLDGQHVIVRDGDKETKIEIDDRSRLLETLAALADANAEKTKKIEKGESDFARLKQRVRDLEDAPAARSISQAQQIATTATNSLAGLASFLDGATLVNVSEFIDRDLKLLASQYQRVFEALSKRGFGEEATNAITTDEESRLASLLDEEDY